MKIKRKISLALALLCVSNISACGDSSAPEDTAETTTAQVSETTVDPLADNLPDKTFDGYEFRLFTFGDNVLTYVPEGESGEVVDDATYRRNRTVEERFDVKISAIDSGETAATHRSAIEKLILAGDEVFDLVLNNGKQLAGESVSGHFMNLYDIKYLDFSMPWWSDQLVDDLVFDGKWTIGKMIEMTKDVYSDLNGNATADEADFYGLLSTYSHNTWAVSFDIPVWEKNGDTLTCVAMSNKMLDAFDIIKGYFKEEGVFETLGANSANMFAVPIFASDTERTGIILKALSAEGYKQLIPAYYEIALKSKYLRDENSIKMLDLITATRTISFSYCYDNFNAALGFGNCLTSSYSDSFASFYASRENIVKSRLEELATAFADN